MNKWDSEEAERILAANVPKESPWSLIDEYGERWPELREFNRVVEFFRRREKERNKIMTWDRQRHPDGFVGYLFRAMNPKLIRIGSCFFSGRLLEKDLVLCVEHTGDCFQDYIFIQEFSNGLKGLPDYRFGSYGMEGAERLGEVPTNVMMALQAGGFVEFAIPMTVIPTVPRTIMESTEKKAT